jgi:hypothetical protein
MLALANKRRAERYRTRKPVVADPPRHADLTLAGTPEQVADLIDDWFKNGAADRFNIMPPPLPAMLDVFSAEVIPLLRRRGLFRTEYDGITLREHYGLEWPESVFAQPARESASLRRMG